MSERPYAQPYCVACVVSEGWARRTLTVVGPFPSEAHALVWARRKDVPPVSEVTEFIVMPIVKALP